MAHTTAPEPGADGRPDGASVPNWEQLYEREFAHSVRLAGLLLGDYQFGEEIAQEAFVRLLQSRRQITDPSAYLHGIVVNLCRSHVRRAIFQRRLLARATSRPASGEDGSAAVAERLSMTAALASLPRRQREAVVLRYYAGLGEREVARTMGVSVGSVKTHLHRAMGSLATRLEEA